MTFHEEKFLGLDKGSKLVIALLGNDPVWTNNDPMGAETKSVGSIMPTQAQMMQMKFCLLFNSCYHRQGEQLPQLLILLKENFGIQSS